MKAWVMAALGVMAAGAAQAAEIDLGKVIASDLAQRRGMVALEDAGTSGAVIGGRYANGDCRREFEKAVRKGRAMSFGLVGTPPTLDPTLIQTSLEERYQLDRNFTSRNKASIGLLAKLWNVKVDAAADLIRKSNISFNVYRKRYPAFDLPRLAAIGPGEEAILGGMTPPAGTVSTPYEVLFVTDFQFSRTSSTGGSLSIAAEAAEQAKAAISISAQRDANGQLVLPDDSAVAYKPIIVWDAPRCKR